jgi:hypothetical protein
MPTAQQIFVDQFATLLNANPNLNTRIIASSPSAGLLRVTTRNADTPQVLFSLGGSTIVNKTGTFVSRAATGSPKYAELYFSWTLAPGDTVAINVGTNITTSDVNYNLPLGTAVDPGGLNHTTIGGGGVGGGGGTGGGVAIGGSGVGTARNRRLVVMECGAASASFGSLFALDPQDAVGVAIPTFRVVTSLPTVGSSMGESVYVTATRQGYVWDGTAWRDITASPIRSFANDAALQANTTEPVGAYAVASDTGNMYVRTPNGWRRIGITEFATYADLVAYNAPLGAQALSHDFEVVFLRTLSGGVPTWRPITSYVATEAAILATQNISGMQAVATDSARTYVNDGTRWVEQPIRHYDTEAQLLAAIPPENTLAWANDTSHIFTWTNAKGWLGLNTGMDDPIPLGAIMDFPVRAIPNGWLECDGSAIPAGARYDDLRAVLGTTNLPDLRGLFTRGAKTGEALLSKVNWTTGRPRNTLTGTTGTDGSHRHMEGGTQWHQTDVPWGGGTAANGVTGAWRNEPGWIHPWTSTEGAHSHNVVIGGGGDTETAPDHARLVKCIKAFHITQARPAPDTILSALVNPTAGQTLQFDAATSTWKNASPGIVGTIEQSMLTDAQFIAAAGSDGPNWVLADGRNVAGSRYAQITGSNTVPDLRGAFLRMAGTNASNGAWVGGGLKTFTEDTTRRPRNTNFGGTVDANGNHGHGIAGTAIITQSTTGHNLDPGTTGAHEGAITPQWDGNHAHTFSVTTGGDTETAPKHYNVNYFVRIN